MTHSPPPMRNPMDGVPCLAFMVGIIKRKFKKKRCCFIEANGVRYFVFDPLKRWKDGDVVQFIPGIDEKGPVAQFVEGVGDVAGNKTT